MFRLSPIPRRTIRERECLLGELAAALGRPPQVDGFDDLAQDESGAGAFAPDVAVFPKSTAEVAAVMRIASAHGVPVTPRGAGSGKSGGCLPVAGGILLVTRDLNRIVELSAEDNLAVVEPGLILGELQRAALERGRFYPPDPASADFCTVGGTVAENAGGPRAFKYGVTRDFVLGLEAVLPNGEVIRTGRRTRKGVAGYDLTALLCGSEGSLAVITQVTLALVPRPRALATALMGFGAVADAVHAVRAMIDCGEQPACLELLDAEALDAVRGELRGVIGDATRAALIVEIDGEGALEERLARLAERARAADCVVAADETQRRKLWDARKAVSPALKRRYAHKVSEDICVPPSRIPEMIAAVRATAEPRGFAYATYGHAGDGNLHTNILWNDAALETRVDDVLADIYRAAVALGGTITGEHGVGLVKREFLAIEQGPSLIALQRRLKAVFDPHGLLNPHKLFPEERSVRLAGGS